MIKITGLTVALNGSPILKNISFEMSIEKLGIVGESGSGKTMLARTLLGFFPESMVASAQEFSWDDHSLLSPSNHIIRGYRPGMAMIMQDPKASLNPMMRVSEQLMEVLEIHEKMSSKEAYQKSVEALENVQINDAERVMKSYPHEVSGGMAQRIMIAMMLLKKPKLLIADECTSALDIPIQEDIIQVLQNCYQATKMGLIFISHDLNLVSRFCDRILIMYRGQIVETIQAKDLNHARHPYTQGLLACMPKLNSPLDPLPTLKRDEKWAQ